MIYFFVKLFSDKDRWSFIIQKKLWREIQTYLWSFSVKQGLVKPRLLPYLCDIYSIFEFRKVERGSLIMLYICWTRCISVHISIGKVLVSFFLFFCPFRFGVPLVRLYLEYTEQRKIKLSDVTNNTAPGGALLGYVRLCW